jgi:hypothetical protein
VKLGGLPLESESFWSAALVHAGLCEALVNALVMLGAETEGLFQVWSAVLFTNNTL